MNTGCFDEVISRRGTNCAKYDEMDEKYGKTSCTAVWPIWIFTRRNPYGRRAGEVTDHGIYGYTNLPSCYPAVVGEWIRREYGCRVEDEWILFSPRINIGLNMAVGDVYKAGRQDHCSHAGSPWPYGGGE